MDLCPRHRIGLSANGYCPTCLAETALTGADTDGETPIASIGGYELLAELGRGGMGVVYRARQPGLHREVALKLLPVGTLAGGESIRRFRREAEMAAKLQHPNIVQVFEAGEAEGELYYSMEWVPGGDLTARFEPGKLAPAHAARLTRELALALDHAHRQGVLHRDLKPSNILVNDAGTAKIADFGLARPFDTTGESAGETRSLGSPAYLAPELIRGSSATPSSDLYSLGAVLYFLLCGRPPFVSASLEELLRQVRNCEPPPPRLLNPAVPRDLQKICLKTLDKHPGRRYADADALADDLQRFLDGRPVLARPVGPLVKGWRAAKRAPWLAASLAALALVLVAGIAGILSQSRIANRRAAEVREKAAALRRHLYASDILAASLAIQRGETSLARSVLSRWNDSPPDDDPRGFEWRHLRHLSRPTAHRLLDRREATITSVAVSDDGRRIAVADQGGLVKLHPTGDGPAKTLAARGEEAAFIPSSLGDGIVLADPAGTVRWYDREERLVAECPGRQFSLASAVPRAAVASVPRYHWWVHGGDAAVFDWKENRLLREFPGNWRQAVISPDGGTVALAAINGGLTLASLADGTSRELPTPVPVWGLSFSPDSAKLAAAHRHGTLLWNLNAPETPPAVFPHALTVWTTAFSGDGRLLLTASSDRRARLWMADDPHTPPRVLSGHRSEVWCAAFLGGNEVVSAGKDREALRWTLEDAGERKDVFTHDRNELPVFSPDGRHFLTQNAAHPEWHDLASGRCVRLPAGFTGLGFSPDGTSILLATANGSLGRSPLDDPERFIPIPAPPPAGAVRHLRSLSDGRWIARILADGAIELIDSSNGGLRHRLQGPPPAMRHATAGCPAGRWIAVCGDGDPSLTLHDLENGVSKRLEPVSSYYYVAAAFSPDGKLLAAGDLSGPVQIWSVPDGRPLATLPGHPEETSGVSFSPDGRTLATLGHHQGLKLWHVPTWSEMHSIDLDGATHHLLFSPDGKRLAVTFGDSRCERVDWLVAPPAE